MNRRILILNIFIFVLIIGENTAVIFKITNVQCESFNESWVKFSQCRLRAKSRNVTKLTIILNLTYPVNNVYVHGALKKRANGYKPFLFDVTLDACAFMRKPNNPIVKIVYSMIKDSTSINHTCPYVGEQYIKDFQLNYDYLRGLPLPTGDYLVLITWLFNKKPQFITNVYFNFVEDL